MSYGTRSDGLVQRRNVAATTTVTQDEEDEKPYEEEEEDHDSKETRLTLMEEVLLLGLKDREVVYENICSRCKTSLSTQTRTLSMLYNNSVSWSV